MASGHYYDVYRVHVLMVIRCVYNVCFYVTQSVYAAYICIYIYIYTYVYIDNVYVCICIHVCVDNMCYIQGERKRENEGGMKRHVFTSRAHTKHVCVHMHMCIDTLNRSCIHTR